MKKQNCWEVWYPSNGHPARRIRGGFYWMPGDIRTFKTLGDIPDDIYEGDDKSFSGDHQKDRDFVIRRAQYDVPRNDKRLVTHPMRDAEKAESMVGSMKKLAARMADKNWETPKDIPDGTVLAVDIIALYGVAEKAPEAPVEPEPVEPTDDTGGTDGKGGKTKAKKE